MFQDKIEKEFCLPPKFKNIFLEDPDFVKQDDSDQSNFSQNSSD